MDLVGLEAVEEVGHINGGNALINSCKDCLIGLTVDNAAKKNKIYYRNQCKPCRSKQVTKFNTGNPKRKAYINDRARKIGKVKQYPCESCNTLCYKKYARAFCSDKCRFIIYVEKTDTCWIWKGTKNRRGYGKFCFKGNNWSIASRTSYELFKGPIEKGMFVCHLCDIPSCVNPDHLWVGSHVENILDMIEKERQHSKLFPMEVVKLRKLWEQGINNAELCKMFNVTSGTVSSIIHRRIWKHI